MEFKKSKYDQLEEIMKIIDMAKAHLKDQKIDQWQKGYPNENSIKTDIDKGEGFVLVDGGRVVATTAVSFRPEQTYKDIHQGKWLSDGDYGVIHRIAVDMTLKGKGIAGIFMGEIEKLCKSNHIFSIKVDTHRDNEAMKKFLEKNGFVYCGIIYLADGDERFAYEKLLRK